MALSTDLMHYLTVQDDKDPASITKRLTLAENVLNRPDLPIVRKEDCIFRWLWEEVQRNNSPQMWKTIHHCMTSETNAFMKLSPETKNIIYEQLTVIFREWPQAEIQNEVLQCCSYIFLNTEFQNFVKNKKFTCLFGSMLTFMSKVLSQRNNEAKTDLFYDLCLECATNAITRLSQICKQSQKEKQNTRLLFINDILFPLSELLQNAKVERNTKLAIETRKCIQRLFFNNNQLLQ